MAETSRADGRRPVAGVMGAGYDALAEDVEKAERLGELLAQDGWVVLTGGRNCGVMAGACRGAKAVAGSLTVGVLPDGGGVDVAPWVDVAIFTGLGMARNAVNVLSSDVVFACGRGGSGTASEVALALKGGKPVVLLAATPEAVAFYRQLDPRVRAAGTPEEALSLGRKILAAGRTAGAGCAGSRIVSG